MYVSLKKLNCLSVISNKRMNVLNKVFVSTKGDDLFPHLTKTTMYDI